MTDFVLLQKLAHEIWHEHYAHILSPEQITYMLAQGYDIEVLRAQEREGVRFEIVEGGIGFLAYGPLGDGVFKLHKLYLRAAARGQGHGQRLLQQVEDSVRALGGTRLVLNVNKRNALAIAAYERANFKREQAVVVDIGGGFVMDDYVYVKRLA